MTTVLIVYLLLGLVIGWLTCRRRYDMHLKTANEQRKQAAEALGRANALTTVQTLRFEALCIENQQLKSKLDDR